MVLPANLWFTNSVSLVSKIQVDAGDGLGYRTITTGTPLPVMYADTGLKTWDFKVFLIQQYSVAKPQPGNGEGNSK